MNGEEGNHSHHHRSESHNTHKGEMPCCPSFSLIHAAYHAPKPPWSKPKRGISRFARRWFWRRGNPARSRCTHRPSTPPVPPVVFSAMVSLTWLSLLSISSSAICRSNSSRSLALFRFQLLFLRFDSTLHFFTRIRSVWEERELGYEPWEKREFEMEERVWDERIVCGRVVWVWDESVWLVWE